MGAGSAWATAVSRSRSEVWRQGPRSSCARSFGQLPWRERPVEPRDRHFVHHPSRSRRPGHSAGAQGGASDTKPGPRTPHDLSPVPTRCPSPSQGVPGPHNNTATGGHSPNKVSAFPTTTRRRVQAGDRRPDDGLFGHWRRTSRQPTTNPPADPDTSHRQPNSPPAGPDTSHRQPNSPPADPDTSHRQPNSPPAGPDTSHRQPNSPPAGPDTSHRQPNKPTSGCGVVGLRLLGRGRSAWGYGLGFRSRLGRCRSASRSRRPIRSCRGETRRGSRGCRHLG
ncbi:hypothetical protein EV648_104544 [Kribbella sp. VKM Ac-2568]|nr:hypothetical protein EV648_104544 [Kribbella sp. VKM Ac-2568]